uniref:Uncharacterized protein n=1 Tax=Clastoptera arizonana TaxID=38151 RepID=A0A1B6C1D9_9HEMI
MDTIILQLYEAIEDRNWKACKELLQNINNGSDARILHFAAYLGETEIIELLIKDGVDINYKNENGMSALHFAVLPKSHHCIDELPKISNDGLNFENYEPRTDNYISQSRYDYGYKKQIFKRFHMFAECYHIGLTNYLTPQCANKVSLQRQNSETNSLHNVPNSEPKVENIKTIDILLKLGANLNTKLKCGKTPLLLAIEYGHIENLKHLLKYEPDFYCKIKDLFPLHLAAISNTDVLRLMVDVINSKVEYNEIKLKELLNKKTENGLTPLHLSVKHNKIENMKLLLEKGAEVNSTCHSGHTPLHIAIKKLNTEAVALLLDFGADTNISTQDEKTSLILAIENDCLDIFNLIIKKDSNIHSMNKVKETPLYYAAKQKNEYFTKTLLGFGADVNAKNYLGKTPLMVAVENNFYNNMKLILQCDPDVNAACISGYQAGYSALHYAAKSENIFIEELILAGANVDAITRNGKTPLHLAVEYCKLNNIKSLITCNADVNVSSASGDFEEYSRFVFDSNSNNIIDKLLQNENEYYNLHFFSKESNELDIIVKYKPVVNLHCNNESIPPIHFSIKGCTDEISVILLPKNYSRNQLYLSDSILKNLEYTNFIGKILQYESTCPSCSSENYTPLHFASRKNNPEIIKLLLKTGANIDARTSSGETPLSLAVEHCQVENVKMLINYKPDVNITLTLGYNSGYSILHLASARNNPEILKILLKSPTNVNAFSSNGETPLFVAVKLDRMENIQTLVKHGIDFQNENNKLAFLFSITNSNKKISEFLKNYFELVSNDIKNVKLLHQSIFKKINIFDDFIKLGIDVNYKVENGDALIHVACKVNNMNVINTLLKYHADINCFDSRGNTPLHIATENKNIEMMYLFLKYGAKVNLKNNFNGYTALNLACKNYDHTNPQTEKCIKELLINNADVNIPAYYGAVPICHITSKHNSLHLLKILLEVGANVNATDDNCRTPLHIACQKFGNTEVKYIQLLISYGADINCIVSIGKQAFTPLHFACSTTLSSRDRNYDEIDDRIVLLVENGAELSAKNCNGHTPIYFFLQSYYHCHYSNSRFTSKSYGGYDVPTSFVNTFLFFIENLVAKELSTDVISMINDLKGYFYHKDLIEPLCLSFHSHLKDCEEEFKLIKNYKLNLVDLLSTNEEILASFILSNKNLDFNEIKTNFPIYSKMLIKNFNKGKVRNKLIQFIKNCINNLSKSNLPSRVLEKIISQLELREFRIFMLVMNSEK